jgi:hypothetical protein
MKNTITESHNMFKENRKSSKKVALRKSGYIPSSEEELIFF